MKAEMDKSTSSSWSSSISCYDMISCGKGKRNKPDDMLSSLPDALICHIFSFLEIQDVIRTSALSKCWRDTWTKTPAICLSFGPAGPRKDSLLLQHCEEVMIRCTSLTIHKFHVMRFPPDAASQGKLNPWLKLAVQRGVKDLHIGLSTPAGDYALPKILFASQSVVSLGISSWSFDSLIGNASCSVNWSSLKVLRVEYTCLCDDVMSKVLKGSPLLESLELKGCHGMRHIQVHSTKMRELAIHSCDLEKDIAANKDQLLEISAPNLSTLRFLGHWPSKVSVRLNDISMLKALFVRFIPVRTIVIEGGYLQGAEKRDLRHLECDHLTMNTTTEEGELVGMAHLLNSARELRNLTITITSPDSREEKSSVDGDAHISPSSFDGCQMGAEKALEFWATNLKKVEFRGMDWRGKRLLPLIKLILERALVLEVMVIDADIPLTGLNMPETATTDRMWDLLKINQEVLNCKKGSRKLKIILN